MRFSRFIKVAIIWSGLAPFVAHADFTRNIMLTGYWPQTNEMIRRFSNNSVQNPAGWIGRDWEGRGYDVYSFFPEFPKGLGRGVGDLEVDYQDTSEDFWRLTDEIDPLAIITFSRGSRSIQPRWEIEWRQRNLSTWIDDFEAPFQPTPSPPDASVPAGTIRFSSLPMEDIRDNINAAGIGVDAFIDQRGFGGRFVSEFIAYHGTWYHDLHADPTDPAWNIAAGHVHVSFPMDLGPAIQATDITLRTLTDYLDTRVPEPASAALLAGGLLLAYRGRGLRKPSRRSIRIR